MQKHRWLELHSVRTQKYRLEDITVVIPSAAGRFERRWEWFWPQYIENTNDKVINQTIIPCDPEEVPILSKLTEGRCLIIPAEPRFIVAKTSIALQNIFTRLTFRLANDIMVIRSGWEKVILDRFNSVDKLQLIAELQHGVAYPENHQILARDWDFFRREYVHETTAAVYPHGSRLLAQTAVWRAYYTVVPRYTYHDHDELFFSQIARGDGIVFTNMAGMNAYLAHVGFPNKDFTDDRLQELIDLRNKYQALPADPAFRTAE